MRAMKVLGCLTAATVVMLAVANWADIKRYIRISTM